MIVKYINTSNQQIGIPRFEIGHLVDCFLVNREVQSRKAVIETTTNIKSKDIDHQECQKEKDKNPNAAFLRQFHPLFDLETLEKENI